MKETDDLNSSIIQFLNAHGHFAWRANTIGMRGRTISKNSRGIGDIVCVLRPSGQHLEIETKKRGEEHRESQVRHAEEITRCGAIHIFVESFDEFEEFYNCSFLPPYKIRERRKE